MGNPNPNAGKEGEKEVGQGIEALRRLNSTEPPLFLSPSPDLSHAARAASQYLFSSLLPSCPKSPFHRLLVEGFDAEQIWQQIHLQTQPLLSSLRRDIHRFVQNPPHFPNVPNFTSHTEESNQSEGLAREENEREGSEEEAGESEDFDQENKEFSEGEDEEEDEEEEEGGGGGIEDRFLKIKELGEYLQKAEEREYGSLKKEKHRGRRIDEDEDEEDEEEDEYEDDNEDEDDDEMEGFATDGKGAADLEIMRYEDFFGSKKKKSSTKKPESSNESEDGQEDNESEDGQEDNESEDEQEDNQLEDEQENNDFDDQKRENLSTHEKELLKARSKIEQMEKENFGPKSWTMMGEVTASKRPKNSALEVDLDFEHNVRPAPVITEEVTASLEELIKKRILEGHFDDVQRAPILPSRAPKEFKELDENKSQKGLAELYEEEYAQKAGLAAAPLSFTDEQKKEASLLFKKLCLKLDALSHFHFTPKPVIEEMSIQANVPALAMEEIAPVAVSDAAMLAPEEVFTGKGDIKEDVELTQAERKRRRANKKRKFKAKAIEHMATKKARENAVLANTNGQEES